MNKYTDVEKPQRFVPLGSDYERFVCEQEAKRIKRIPERGAQLPPQKKEVTKMQERMQQSLEGSKPTKQSASPARPTQPPPPPPPKEKSKPKYISGFEKAGKPSKIRAGGARGEYSSEQLESRKRMLRMQKGRR